MSEEVKAEVAPVNYGIENVLALVKFGGALEVAIVAAKADGKLNAMDLPLVFPLVPMLGPLLGGFAKVPKELGDLTDSELEALIAEVAKLPGIGDRANVILKIKAGMKFAHAGYDLFEAFHK